jgi:TonB family protein
MKIMLILLAINSTFAAIGQKVTKIVLLGENGIVQDTKLARSFIVMKKYPDGSYQRLNYKKRGPLQSLQTYGDSTLSFYEGKYLAYHANGNLNCMGYYLKNKKDKTWYYYNDTFKVIKKEIYEAGELIKTIDPDSIQIDNISNFIPSNTEQEAGFSGNNRAWHKFLLSTLDPDIVLKSVKGGTVKVRFIINTSGIVEDVFLCTSVEYVLDEEAIRVISKSPPWNPANQNGKNVNAYRMQPITFIMP